MSIHPAGVGTEPAAAAAAAAAACLSDLEEQLARCRARLDRLESAPTPGSGKGPARAQPAGGVPSSQGEEIARRSKSANSKSDFGRALDMWEGVAAQQGVSDAPLPTGPGHVLPSQKLERLAVAVAKGSPSVVVNDRNFRIGGDVKRVQELQSLLKGGVEDRLTGMGYADVAASSAALAQACLIAADDELNRGDAYVTVASLFPCAPNVVLKSAEGPKEAAEMRLVEGEDGPVMEVVWHGGMDVVNRPVAGGGKEVKWATFRLRSTWRVALEDATAAVKALGRNVPLQKASLSIVDAGTRGLAVSGVIAEGETTEDSLAALAAQVRI